eukprot:555908_1
MVRKIWINSMFCVAWSVQIIFIFVLFAPRQIGTRHLMHKYMRWLFNYIAPTYLFIYWMIYCVLSAIVFTGQFSHNAISNCNIFGAWAAGFSTFAGFVELFNSIASVALFSYPLIRALYQVKLLRGSGIGMGDADHDIRLQFISVMKWNVTLTAIASLSSMTNLFMLLVAGHYIWLFCLGDPFINGLCTFLMIAPNRAYIAGLCCAKPAASDKPSKELRDTRSYSCKSKTDSNDTKTPNCDVATLPQSGGAERDENEVNETVEVTVHNVTK